MVENAFISSLDSIQKGKLPDWNADEWAKLKEEYPCFAGAYMLEAIHSKNSDEQNFETILPTIALRVPNRATLYDRVHADYNQTSQTARAEKLVVEDKVETVKVEAEKQEESKEELKSLVAEIREKRKNKPKAKKLTKKRVNIEGDVNKNRAKESKPKRSDKSETQVKVEKTPASFTDWLKNKKSVDTKTTEVPIDPAASHEAALYLEAKKSSHQLEDFLVDAIEKKQQKKRKQAPQSTFAISETYAQILAQQGKIEEAINVYKELSIEYPKKSSTFARQIEKLKSN